MKTESGPSVRQRSLGALLLAATLLPTAVVGREAVEVRIDGVSGEARANVEAALRINRRRSDPGLSGETIAELHRSAEAEIRLALEPYGYYRPEIDSELVAPADGTPIWQATYDIDPGPPVPITTLDARLLGPGSETALALGLLRSIPLSEGQPFRHPDYERAKGQLVTEIRNHGYLDAAYMEHRVEVDVAAYTASIRLAIDTGPLYVLGPITFVQQEPEQLAFDQPGPGSAAGSSSEALPRSTPGSSRFAEGFLKRYLVLKPGDPLNQNAIAEQRRLLSRSGYFEEVLIQRGEPTSETQPAMPLTIHLTPLKANRYRAQLGWGTDTGAGLQGDWNRRYLGRNGHHFTFGGTAVQDQDRLAGDLRYSIPLDPLTGERLELTARLQSRTLTFEDVDLDEGGETRIINGLLSAFWHYPLPSLGGFEWRGRAGLSVVSDSYDIFEILFGNLSESTQEAIIAAIGMEAFDTLAPDFEAVVPSVRLTAKRTDNDLYIRRGDYFDVELLGANTAVGSNIDFWQVRLSSWTIRPVGHAGRLLLRATAGYSDAETRNVLGADFNRMPEFYEFRAGGARSVRGYRFEELFPANAITGGKHQLTGSVEYEHEIIPDWSIAAFVDAGNAFNDREDINEKFGAGLGARWRSPVGLARVDLAFPLDDSTDSFQIYITVGPEF